MSTANTSITQRKDVSYIKQTMVEQNNKKSIKVSGNSETSKCAIVQKQFLICQLCFWCASYYAHSTAKASIKFDIDNTEGVQCPSCNTKGKVQSLPILYNHRYAYGEHI
jgi:hypothetical protein